MRSTPLIGLTTYGRKLEGKFSLPAEYADSVRRAGGIPVLLSPGESNLHGLVERLDGIILSGGGDIHPGRYGGKDHSTIYNLDEERDESELELMRIILEKQIPTLAICRGMQILNIFLGGTLYEHIPDTFGETVLHRLPPRETAEHPVKVATGSKLSAIVRELEIMTVSWHHQAVKDIPKDLIVTARSEDGVIEGVEFSDHPFLVAVQWHPELSSARDPLQQALFNALIEASPKK